MPIEKIENLIDGNGCIFAAPVKSTHSAANVADEEQCLAMLAGFEGEPLMDLLRRLDAAIDDAYENRIFADEVSG